MDRSRFTGTVEPEFICHYCSNVLVRPVRAPCTHEVCHACLPRIIDKAHAEVEEGKGEASPSADHSSRHRRPHSSSERSNANNDGTNESQRDVMSPTRLGAPEETEIERVEIPSSRRYLCPVPGCGCSFRHDERMAAPKTTSLLEKLEISCDNAPNCPWSGRWGDMQNHREKHCEYEEIPCVYAKAGCGVRLQRKEIPEHARTCAYRTEQCHHCLKLFKLLDLPLHVKKCTLAIVKCPQCESEFARGVIDDHIKKDCPETVISCPIAEFGCAAKMPRKALAAHVQESSHSHLATLVEHLRSEKERHESIVENLRLQVLEQQGLIDTQLSCDGRPFSVVAAELRTVIAEQQKEIDKFVRAAVITVDLNGCGHFKTVTEALERCAAGDTIILRPGTYTESLVVTKPGVTIRGVSAEEVTLTSEQGSCVSVRGVADVTVSHLTVVGNCRVSPALRIDKAHRATVASCVVSSVNLSCIQVCSGEDVCLRDSTFFGSRQSGVDWRSKDRGGVVQGCTVKQNTQPNVTVHANARVLLAGCEIFDGQLNGVWVKPRGRCRISGGRLFRNKYSNIDVSGSGSACVISEAEIFGSEKCGVCATEGAAIAISSSKIHSNALPNVAVLPGATAELRENHITNGQLQGLVVKAAGTCRSFGDVIEGNLDLNIAVEPGADFAVLKEVPPPGEIAAVAALEASMTSTVMSPTSAVEVTSPADSAPASSSFRGVDSSAAANAADKDDDAATSVRNKETPPVAAVPMIGATEMEAVPAPL